VRDGEAVPGGVLVGDALALAVGAGEPDTDEAAVRDGEAVPGGVLVGDVPTLRLALGVGDGESIYCI
jgi:hypothetical protein